MTIPNDYTQWLYLMTIPNNISDMIYVAAGLGLN